MFRSVLAALPPFRFSFASAPLALIPGHTLPGRIRSTVESWREVYPTVPLMVRGMGAHAVAWLVALNVGMRRRLVRHRDGELAVYVVPDEALDGVRDAWLEEADCHGEACVRLQLWGHDIEVFYRDEPIGVPLTSDERHELIVAALRKANAANHSATR